jgi:hypothetical protein
MAVRRALVGGFALPVEIEDRTKIESYQVWFEDALMSELRSLSPETYQEVVTYLRTFILMPWDDDDED